MTRAQLAAVRAAAGGRCEYCHMPEACDPLPFQVDHVVAEQHGGPTEAENLAWSCLHCNKHKGPNIAGIDPDSGQLAALFHPRSQNWNRHFAWEGPISRGRTRSGRATVRVLAINDPDFVAFRAELMDEGEFR